MKEGYVLVNGTEVKAGSYEHVLDKKKQTRRELMDVKDRLSTLFYYSSLGELDKELVGMYRAIDKVAKAIDKHIAAYVVAQVRGKHNG